LSSVASQSSLACWICFVQGRGRCARHFSPSFIYIVILALAFLNSLVHAGDGWTAVVPYGLAISVVTFVLSVFAAAISARKYSRLAWRI